MEYKGQRVLVVGAGKSGLAAAEKLLKNEAQVFITDRLGRDELPGLQKLELLGLKAEQQILKREPDIDSLKPDFLVLSPGVPPTLPFIQEAVARGIPLRSEIEIALKDSPATLVGITGSNGKTTTARLCGELAKKTGRETVVAGNIGLALSGQVEHLNEKGIIVAEFSSFQLEYIEDLRVNIAVVLNFTPDHLDRHGSMENYIAAKARILENQTADDLAILNWDDPKVRALAPLTKAEIMFFSLQEILANGIYRDKESIVAGIKGKAEEIIALKELQLKGNHNVENVAAASAVAINLGLDKHQIASVLKSFQPVEHRQEVVGRFNNILYINDSKGTNPSSAIKALQSYQEPIVLIAGGQNKGLDMTEFLEVVKQKVKSLVLMGEARAEMELQAREIGIERIISAESFEDSVQKAINEAQAGDIVLLSPACTSWDRFKSYEQRGELFKELVRKHYSEPK